jgi:hypothetical protein
VANATPLEPARAACSTLLAQSRLLGRDFTSVIGCESRWSGSFAFWSQRRGDLGGCRALGRLRGRKTHGVMRNSTVRFNAMTWAATRSRAQSSDRPTLELDRENGLDGIAKRGDIVVDERRVLVHHMRSHKRHERQVPAQKVVRQYRAPPRSQAREQRTR